MGHLRLKIQVNKTEMSDICRDGQRHLAPVISKLEISHISHYLATPFPLISLCWRLSVCRLQTDLCKLRAGSTGLEKRLNCREH